MTRETLRYRIGSYRLARRRQAFYRRFVSPGDLCFDVGAHVGDRTSILRGIGARVVAVEPQPRCLAKLRSTFADDPRVVVVDAAVGAAPGETVLHVPPGGPALATLSEEWIERVRASGRFAALEWSESVPVRLTTLDALIDEHGLPRFCKIDVEGYEPEVLAGLGRPIPAVSVEFTPERLDATERCLARLDSLGRYEYAFSIGETLRLASPWLSGENLLAELRRSGTTAAGDVYARLRESP